MSVHIYTAELTKHVQCVSVYWCTVYALDTAHMLIAYEMRTLSHPNDTDYTAKGETTPVWIAMRQSSNKLQ